MGKLIHILVPLIGFGISTLRGQVPAKPSPAPPAKPEPKEVFPAKPLREAADSLDEFVRNASTSFAIGNRTVDPFGLPQDPDAKPATLQPSITAKQEPTVPFSEVISHIQINTVMTGEKKFLVGSRSISLGDRFPLNYEGQTIWIEVTAVNAQQVAFKNLQTGEVAAQQLNILPPGMTPGSNGITAPGMVPSGRQAPLDLSPSGSAPGNAPAVPSR